MVAKLRKAFNTGKTRPKQYRLQQLKSLLRMLEEKEDEIATAIYNDLRRVSVVCCVCKVLLVQSESAMH